jgi:hypothetical protein
MTDSIAAIVFLAGISAGIFFVGSSVIQMFIDQRKR